MFINEFVIPIIYSYFLLDRPQLSKSSFLVFKTFSGVKLPINVNILLLIVSAALVDICCPTILSIKDVYTFVFIFLLTKPIESIYFLIQDLYYLNNLILIYHILYNYSYYYHLHIFQL